MKMVKVKKCEYCEEGICTYFTSLEDQYRAEEDGLPADYCDGSEEQMNECFNDGLEFNERSEI